MQTIYIYIYIYDFCKMIWYDGTAAAVATINNNKTCNCRQKNTFPLDRNSLQSSVIYQATVTRKDNNTTETYIGLTENDFKRRYRNNTASFRHASATLNTETPTNSASISGPSKKTTSNTLFPGAFSHRTRRTTAQVKDVASASKKNS